MVTIPWEEPSAVIVVESVTSVGLIGLPVEGSVAGVVRSALTLNGPPVSLTVHFTLAWSVPSIATPPFLYVYACWPPAASGTLIQWGLAGQAMPAIAFAKVVKYRDTDACAAGATGSLQAATRPKRPSAHVPENFLA